MAGFAVDGKWIGPGDLPQSNRWHASLNKPHPHWVWIKFKAHAKISRVVIHRGDIIDYPVDMVGEYSPDGGKTVRTLFSITGYYGIAFGPEGFKLQPWSPLKGKTTPLGLMYMGKVVKEIK